MKFSAELVSDFEKKSFRYSREKSPWQMFDYNNFYNVLRLLDVLSNFSVIRSETIRDYYL